MKIVLVFILMAVASGGVYGVNKYTSLVAQNQALTIAKETLEERIAIMEENHTATLEDLSIVQEKFQKAIAEREKYKRSFKGLEARLLQDPADTECRINRASAKILNRLVESSGGTMEIEPVECE